MLSELLSIQRRSLLHEQGSFDRQAEPLLVAARALLILAGKGDPSELLMAITGYANSDVLLGSLLRSLSAAAEEHPDLAASARSSWPVVIEQVLELFEGGHHALGDDHLGGSVLSDLMPVRTSEAMYRYRELVGEPITRVDPEGWTLIIDRWVAVNAGSPACADALIGMLEGVNLADQSPIGLPRIEALVLADPRRARRSFRIAGWLTEARSSIGNPDDMETWQRVVDALVAAGDTRLADLID